MFVRAAATFLLLLELALSPTAQAADVAIVLSENGGVYAEFASAFQQFAEGSNWHVRWTGSADNLGTAPRTDLVLTVGSDAARAALRRNHSPPVLATLLPRTAYERAQAELGANRPKGNATAIFLDQPLPRLLAFTRYLLPERRRIGLLAGAETRGVLAPLRQGAGSVGLDIETEDLESNANPVPALNRLLVRSDLLLALPDSAVYRRDNIRSILLTSYRFQRPVIGFSQALVTSGALAAIYSTPTQIARQAVDVIKSLRPELMTLPSPQPPTLFAIAINHNVAQALGVALPDEATIRRALAADKDAK